MTKEIKTISNAIDTVYAMGYTDIKELTFGYNCVKTSGGSHSMVCIEKHHYDSEITFNGETFEVWKELK